MKVKTTMAKMMIRTTTKSGLISVGGAVKVAALLICLALVPIPVHAQTQTPLERVVALVASQGFEVTEMRRTWLGRIRIAASNGTISREIVINRTTGEILRDYWEDGEDEDHDYDEDDDDESHRGGSSDDNDDDDDGDDDKDDDDGDDDDGDDG